MSPTVTVDIGTTSVKLCLFDALGELVASAKQATPTMPDDSGEIYDVPALLGGITAFIRGLPAPQRSSVQRIAVTGVGESGGLVRPDLSLASPLIVWHDQRGARYLESLTENQRTRIYRITGLPASANYALSKAAWTVDRLDGRVDDAQWLNVAEYVGALMCGQRWSEPSLASRTMALDLSTRAWSAEVCALVGLEVGVFPALRPANEGTPITPAFALDVGLGREVQIHVVGHDHMVGAVGAGLQSGDLLNSTGTTEGLLVHRNAPDLEAQAERSKLANGLACTGSDYTLFASIPTGGSAFATLQDLLGMGTARINACLVDLQSRYLAGRVDLAAIPLVLPQFRGAPPPTKNPYARGIIAGLRTDTTSEQIVFGCFLGMALQFKDVLELFGVSPRIVKVIGPASRNPLWLQLKADLLGTPFVASQFPEVVSRGAQALACGETGVWEQTMPYAVAADPVRHAQLTEWFAGVRPQWEHLKASPSAAVPGHGA